MQGNNVLVTPTSNIEGNITSCGIDSQMVSIKRDHAFSFLQTESTRSYNVCTGETVAQYDVPVMTDFGAVLLFFGAMLSFLVLWAVLVGMMDQHGYCKIY